MKLSPQSWNIFGCLRTISHVPSVNVGKLRMANMRNPTRKTEIVTNTIDIQAVRSSPNLARGLFRAGLIDNGSPRLVVYMEVKGWTDR